MRRASGLDILALVGPDGRVLYRAQDGERGGDISSVAVVSGALRTRRPVAGTVILSAVSAARSFLGARIGQISTRPPNFYTVIVNEQDLLREFAHELIRLHDGAVVEIGTPAELKAKHHAQNIEEVFMAVAA